MGLDFGEERRCAGDGSLPPEQEYVRSRSDGVYWEEGIPLERRPSVLLSPDAGIPVGDPFFPAVNQDSLVRWVMRNNPLLTETRARLCNELPMPAGRGALDEWARIWDELFRPEHPSLCPEELGDISEGLPPDSYLGLALERRNPHGSVWLLGPMQPVVADEERGDFWQFADPILRTTELPGGATEVRELGDALRRWYMKDVCGRTVTGRPKGPLWGTDATKTMYESAITSLLRQKKSVTYASIAAAMKPVMGASTLRKYVTEDKVLEPHPAVVERLQNSRRP